MAIANANLASTVKIKSTNAAKDVVLELRDVNKTFRDFWLRPRVKAVQDLNLTVRRGQVLGLLGPNGSGKTTTIKMILGLLYPTSGQIAVLGKRPSDVKLKHKIGYLPEESHLYRFLNAEETLDFYGRLFKIPGPERKGRVDALLNMVGLEAARYRAVGEYSKGMQRRVGLAQALINDPDVLILDEPTTGMDPIATRQIKDLIVTLKSRGKTIILCTHLLGEVEDVCDQLVIMYGGKIRSQGTVDELLTVGDRQSVEVSGGPMDEATVEHLRHTLARDGREVQGVHAPRQRLESLFLSVIDAATKAGERTTGAAVGGSVAGFLSDEAQSGDALLSSLSAGPRKVEAVAPLNADSQSTAGVSPDEIMPVEQEMVDASVLQEFATPPQPEHPTQTSDDDSDPQSDQDDPVKKPTANADDDFLSNLTGKRS